MARLSNLPNQAIISQFKGVVDYYVWGAERGTPIPCARKWPRYERSAYPPTIIPPQQAFARFNSLLKDIPPNLREAYVKMAGGTSLTWKDMATRCYLNADRV